MTRVLPLILAPSLLGACVDPESPAAPPYIAPLDGQTAVASDVDLLVSTGGLDLPPDYPVDPDALRVIDLEAGGAVKGELWREGSLLVFTPKQGWTEGHTYAWTLQEPPDDTRQAHLDLPASLLGDATFRAGDGATVLDAGIDLDGSVCLLLSKAVQGVPPDLVVEISGEPADGAWELRDESPDSGIELLPQDPGVRIACLLDAPELAGGESLRVWWGAGGPWFFALDHVGADELSVEERRREAP